MPALTLLPVLVVAGVIGVAGHEATHYLLWLLGGRRPWFDVWGMCVRADIETVGVRDRVAALAPLMLGASLFPWLVGTGRLTPAVGVAWAFYTLGGVIGDGGDLAIAFSVDDTQG